MIKVILYTGVDEYVVSGWIQKSDYPPAILIWGNRVFQYQTTDGEGVDLYWECITVALTRVD